jgi:hypothetical protein
MATFDASITGIQRKAAQCRSQMRYQHIGQPSHLVLAPQPYRHRDTIGMQVGTELWLHR